jgi:hypothetical protein
MLFTFIQFFSEDENLSTLYIGSTNISQNNVENTTAKHKILFLL